MMRTLLVALCLLSACAHAPQSPAPALSPDRQLYLRGVALAEEGDLTRAEEYLAAAHRAGGRDRASLAALLSVCVKASRLRSMLAYAEPYLHEHPREPALWLLVSSVQLALGELDTAQRSAEHALQVASADLAQQAAAHYLLGRLYSTRASRRVGPEKRASAQQARTHFQRYVELAPYGRHGEELRVAWQAARAPRRAR